MQDKIVPENTAATKQELQLESGSRASLLRFNYGMTLSRWDSIYTAQGGLCIICRQPRRGGKIGDIGLYVDHDHATGKVRGLLCHMCNVGIGHFNEDVALLEAAIAYLKSHRDV